jgi:hypothetical protein
VIWKKRLRSHLDRYLLLLPTYLPASLPAAIAFAIAFAITITIAITIERKKGDGLIPF